MEVQIFSSAQNLTKTLKPDILYPRVKKLLLLSFFVFGNFSILLTAFLFLTVYTTKNTAAAATVPLEVVVQTPSVDQNFIVQPTPPIAQATLSFRDIRTDLLENFFKKYKSPMVGLGPDIIKAADKYQIPFGYLPAIGACEGGLGSKIPLNSFNTWGWGIYGGKITAFNSWQEAIETVTKGLKTNYFSKGLDTPEKIMPIYTPPSQGSWAFCVNKYLAELQ